jgi:hypothetical protein
MSLPSPLRQGAFTDACVLFEDLFSSQTDRYRLFREKIWPCLWAKREILAELYCEDNGRPAIEPVLMLGVTLLQFMEKVPDRLAAVYVRLHMGWKYALDVDALYPGLHFTTLEKFRDRVVAGGLERIGFDAILDGLRQAGLVKKKRKERLDSTHILGAVARMGRLEVVRETVRLFVEAVEQWEAARKPETWSALVERYVDSDFPWHRASIQTLKEKFLQAGADGLSLIKWARLQNGWIRGHEQTLLLERVILEQYELDGDAPRGRKKETRGVVQNPHDPDVQWAAKDQDKKKQWEGYKAQIAETVPENGETKKKGEPTEQFLTEVVTTEAIASDLDGRRRVEAQQEASGMDTAEEVYVDAAYVSDDTLAEAQAEGRELVGPARASPKPQGCFPSDQFDVDIKNRKAVCPAGRTSTQCSRLENQQTTEVQYRFEWASLCDRCPLQKQCTQSKSGRRMLVVGEHHDLLQQRRREMETEAFKQRMHQRNGIEGTISEFTRAGGRRTRYRRMPKVTLGNYLIGAVVNIKRWIRLEQFALNPASVAI